MLDYRTIDADNHYYETRDAFTRHIDKAYADRTFRVHTDADGNDTMSIDGKPYVFSPAKFDRTNPPGSLLAKLGLKTGDELKSVNGMPMGGPEQMLELYGKLRTSPSLDFEIVRNGEKTIVGVTVE